MNKRNRQIAILVLGTAIASPAFAGPHYDDRHGHGYGHDYYAYARVIHVRPVYETVQVLVPQQTCWTESAGYPRGAGLVGAVVGAAVGHQIGEGQGKRIATAAGAVIGAGIAIDSQQRRLNAYGYNVPVQRCSSQPVYVSEQRIVGYRVKYRYNGRVLYTRTDYHPGATIRVRVDVAAGY